MQIEARIWAGKGLDIRQGTLGVERAKVEGNNVLDVEAWGKLCEYGIDSLIL
jgi:hypothetical protein